MPSKKENLSNQTISAFYVLEKEFVIIFYFVTLKKEKLSWTYFGYYVCCFSEIMTSSYIGPGQEIFNKSYSHIVTPGIEKIYNN